MMVDIGIMGVVGRCILVFEFDHFHSLDAVVFHTIVDLARYSHSTQTLIFGIFRKPYQDKVL